MTGIISSGPKDFPRIAKEMGFSFSLRRGRVDWQKIGAIDVDRLVQERDLVSLQENLISIINYNLDSEYDVKILDPNFVKLFKLAQLSIDYLLYSEQHFYNCTELEQRQMKKYIKEIEKLKRECKKKDEVVKNLRKKFNEVQRHQQHLRTGSGEGVSSFFKCSHCGKTFLTAGYLEAHHLRRHPGITFTHLPNPSHSETERLQSEIKELKERLNNTERLLHKESVKATKEKQEAVVRADDWAEEKRQMEEWQQAQQRKYLNEISDLKTVFHDEIKRLKESSQQLRGPTTATNADLSEQIQQQDEELASLREKLRWQSTPDMDSMQSRLEAQERFWKSRLKQMEAAYERQLEGLRVQLDQVKESHNSSRYAEYENNIQKFMDHAVRQDEMLKAQALQILRLTEQYSAKVQQTDEAHQHAVELQPQTRADPHVTFRELTARIDKAVHDGIHTEQLTKSSVGRQTKSPHSVSQTPVATKNIPSPADRSGHPQSQKQSLVVTNITMETVNSTESFKVDPQEKSSSESSPQTLNIRTQATSMYKFTDQELHTSDKGRSPQGSKDSGLDSPKRFSTTSIKKLNAFQGLSSIETTPAISGSEVRADRLDEMTGSDEGGREGEGKEETTSDEATLDETETEMDTDTEPAVKSVLSLENALHQNPRILRALKDDLRDLHARRLREIGVDPEWKGIPAATFQQKMATLKHHQTITAKRHKSFFKIKQHLSDELDRHLSSNETNIWQGKEERDQQRDSTQQSKVDWKGKTKALSVLKSSKGKLSTSSVQDSPKGTNQDKADCSVHHATSPTLKECTQNIDNIMNVDKDTKLVGSNEMSGTLTTVTKMNARSEQTTAPHVTMVTSTPFKNSSTGSTAIFARRRILKGGKSSSVSELVRGNNSVQTPSISHAEDDDMTEEEEESDDVSDRDGMEEAITYKSGQPLHHSQDLYPHQDKQPHSSSDAATRDFSSNQESPIGNKSALKTRQSSSLSSITKKRVLFLDQENELASHQVQGTDNNQTSSLAWNSSRRVATSGVSRSVETLAVDPLSSWDCSPLTSPNKSTELKTQGSTRNSDSDSDWDLSSLPISVAHTAPTGSYQQINLSTKQSDKIAQISKNIQKQLSISRSKPPAGSVEAMLHATESEKSFQYQGTNDSSAFDSNHENDMNLNNTTSAPVPKPRSKQLTTGTKETSIKHSLSDWDLQDFDD